MSDSQDTKDKVKDGITNKLLSNLKSNFYESIQGCNYFLVCYRLWFMLLTHCFVFAVFSCSKDRHRLFKMALLLLCQYSQPPNLHVGPFRIASLYCAFFKCRAHELVLTLRITCRHAFRLLYVHFNKYWLFSLNRCITWSSRLRHHAVNDCGVTAWPHDISARRVSGSSSPAESILVN